MPIDLGILGAQLARLGAYARSQGPRQEAKLEQAVRALRDYAAEHESLGARARSPAARAPFRAAVPLEPLDRRVLRPFLPPDHTVVATDGSQIEPDRHGPVLCHLVNLGSAVIRYGSSPDARLESRPLLRFEEKDVYLDLTNREPIVVQDRLLAIKRQIAETGRLVELARAADGAGPVIGLQDGTLMLSSWSQGDQTLVWNELLAELLDHLDALKEQGVPLGSYVSRPRGSDVVSLLRLATCPYDGAACAEQCLKKEREALPCGSLAGLPDRAVFEALPLMPGERSALFKSSWSTSVQRYGDHAIHFFYVNVGSEIARVEVPQWVAEDPSRLDLVHAVVCDQCQRGQGYPRALIEAHEKAVVTAGDRRIYEQMIQRVLIANGIEPAPSEKERSKRLRSL